ncbi:MAG: DUF4840 domain-containing protein [Prevotella sp.]|nr:DUF4840 domain-containing protein [Prevotella sp.]
MRKTSILTLLLCMIAALTMTSCLSDDDDDSGLTREEQHTAYLSVAGEHSGQLVYYDTIFTSKPSKVDSVVAKVNFDTDSTVTVYNFRVNSIAHFVQDATAKACLENAPAQILKCYTLFYGLSPVTFHILPQKLTFSTTADGTPHTITLAFYAGYPNSYGVKSGKTLGLQIVLGGVYLDYENITGGTNLLANGLALPFYFNAK